MTDFDKIIWRDALTFVDFFASWCGPCQAMHPVVDRFQEQMRGRVELYNVNINSPEMVDIIRRYEIRSVPTLMFFRNG
ncbi:MAG: thioredoxin, partial [Alistipes sp.]|nr:thioredoxin [Alistipes sp.]